MVASRRNPLVLFYDQKNGPENPGRNDVTTSCVLGWIANTGNQILVGSFV